MNLTDGMSDEDKKSLMEYHRLLNEGKVPHVLFMGIRVGVSPKVMDILGVRQGEEMSVLQINLIAQESEKSLLSRRDRDNINSMKPKDFK